MNRVYNAAGGAERSLDSRLVKNSAVLVVGQWITDQGVGVTKVTSIEEQILGLIVAFEDANGTNLEVGTAASLSTGSYVKSTKTFTAGSDNQTVDVVKAVFIPARPGMQFVATLSATKGTTTGSDKRGYYLNVHTATNSAQLLETSASATLAVDATTKNIQRQFRIVKASGDGFGTSEVVVEPVHSQYIGNVQ